MDLELLLMSEWEILPVPRLDEKIIGILTILGNEPWVGRMGGGGGASHGKGRWVV